MKDQMVLRGPPTPQRDKVHTFEFSRRPKGRGKDKGAAVQLTKDQVDGMLKRFDRNGDGRLSRKELEEVFAELGAYFSGWRASRALKHADQDGDGYIEKHEFPALLNYAFGRGYSIK